MSQSKNVVISLSQPLCVYRRSRVRAGGALSPQFTTKCCSSGLPLPAFLFTFLNNMVMQIVHPHVRVVTFIFPQTGTCLMWNMRTVLCY